MSELHPTEHVALAVLVEYAPTRAAELAEALDVSRIYAASRLRRFERGDLGRLPRFAHKHPHREGRGP